MELFLGFHIFIINYVSDCLLPQKIKSQELMELKLKQPKSTAKM